VKVKISAISYHLPDKVEGVDVLQRDNPDWDMPRILEKTGVHNRYISSPDETAVDLAFKAGEKLFENASIRNDVDLLILVTQSPDYVLPSSACILQDRFCLLKNCMAFDVNLGCSGFVYSISIAGGLIESGVVSKCLILCADTYSKYIKKNDRTCRPVFSDGAAAILLEKSNTDCIGPFEFGTDGSGYDRLIVKDSGARGISQKSNSHLSFIEMRGSDVFLFTMRVVPVSINNLLKKAGIGIKDIDVFVFHQASKFVIDNLIQNMSLDRGKVFINYDSIGNTVSASIPIALKDAVLKRRLKEGDTIMIVGFGVGLSWGAALMRWSTIS